jgi:hypothetical protein
MALRPSSRSSSRTRFRRTTDFGRCDHRVVGAHRFLAANAMGYRPWQRANIADDMPGGIVSAIIPSFSSVEKRRRRGDTGNDFYLRERVGHRRTWARRAIARVGQNEMHLTRPPIYSSGTLRYESMMERNGSESAWRAAFPRQPWQASTLKNALLGRDPVDHFDFKNASDIGVCIPGSSR